MTYWDTLTRQRDNRALARALSPIMRPMGGEDRNIPVMTDAGRTIAALRAKVAQQQAELRRLRTELINLRGRPA